MRVRSKKLIVAFHTTADAMAMERYCRRDAVAGRLLSVPRSVTADCGIAWCAALEDRAKLERIVREEKMEIVGLFEVEM